MQRTTILALLAAVAFLPPALAPALAQAPAQPRRGGPVELLPVPPIPPEIPPLADAAPTPGTIAAPVAAPTPREATLMPTLMPPKQVYQGEGFLAGSTVQSEQQRKARPAAGFNLTVPLR